MINAQEFVNQNYFDKKIKILNLEDKDLEGHLDLSEFTDLEELNCSYNGLTGLDLSKCSNLAKLNCSYNLFDDLYFLDKLPKHERLISLIFDNCGVFILQEEIENAKALFVNLEEQTGNSKIVVENQFSKGELIDKLLAAKREISELKNLSVRLKRTKAKSVISDFEAIREVRMEREKDWERLSGSGAGGYELLQERRADFSNDVIDVTDWSFGALPTSSQLELEIIEKDIKHLRKLEKKQEKIEQLQKEKTLFEEQESEIKYLEVRVRELIDLIKQQKNKIMSSFLRLFPEKELLQELIMTHLKFTRFKKQEFDSLDYDEKHEEYEDKFRDIKKQLRTKLDKKTMNEISRIVVDCEELVNQELELEVKLNNKTHLIEGHKQNPIFQIVDDNEEAKELTLGKRKVIEKEEETQQKQIQQFKKERSQSLLIELAKTRAELDAKKEENNRLWERLDKPSINNFFHGNQQVAIGDNANLSTKTIYQTQYIQNYQQLATELEQEIESLDIKNITPQEQQVINQAILFLGTKELFINYRQNSINNLINCYNKLEKFTGKLSRFTDASNIMGITSKLVKIIPGGEVAEAPIGLVGDAINLAGTTIRGKSLDKFIKKFQEILDKDQKKLPLFDENYQSLAKVIWSDKKISEQRAIAIIIKTLKLNRTKSYPFSDDHNVFSNKVSGIWKGRTSLELGEIKNSIESIMKDLESFKEKFYQEKEQLGKQAWFKAIEKKTDLLKDQQVPNWQNIHFGFVPQLVRFWTNNNFTYNQAQDWIKIGLTPQDHSLANYLKNQKNLTPEEVLNHHNLEDLKAEFEQSQQTPQIIHNPPKNN